MKYQLKEFNRNVPDTDLLNDLKKIANNLGTTKLSSRDYNDNNGKYTAGTIAARFGSWNKALERAGLKSVMKHHAPELELFKNIESVWIKLGRQPVTRDLKRPLSEFSPRAYINRFGTFRNALEAFVEFINLNSGTQQIDEIEIISEVSRTEEIIFKHKTKRYPNERLKVQVLMRDGEYSGLFEPPVLEFT